MWIFKREHFRSNGVRCWNSLFVIILCLGIACLLFYALLFQLLIAYENKNRSPENETANQNETNTQST